MSYSSPKPAFLFDLDGTLVGQCVPCTYSHGGKLESCGIQLFVWRIHRRVGMRRGLFTAALLRKAREISGSLTSRGSTFTQALGLNNVNEIVGTYNDKNGFTHGFVYNFSTNKLLSVDDPNGIGMTVANGTNDQRNLVGLWGASPTNTGFVATLP